MCRFFNQICENKLENSKLPKSLESVKIIHYDSLLFIRVLRHLPRAGDPAADGRRPQLLRGLEGRGLRALVGLVRLRSDLKT